QDEKAPVSRLVLDGPFAGPGDRRLRHEAGTKGMARVAAHALSRRLQGPLHYLGNGMAGKTLVAHAPVPVHRPKKSPVLDAGEFEPHPNCPHGTGFRTTPKGDPDLSPLTNLVGLTLSYRDDKALVSLGEVGNVKAHELTPPHGAGEAKEKKCPVPGSEKGVGKRSDHEAEMLRQGGLFVILRDTLFAPDALPDEADLRPRVG